MLIHNLLGPVQFVTWSIKNRFAKERAKLSSKLPIYEVIDVACALKKGLKCLSFFIFRKPQGTK